MFGISMNKPHKRLSNRSCTTFSVIWENKPGMDSYFSTWYLMPIRICWSMVMVASAIWASKSLDWHLPSSNNCFASLKKASMLQRIWHIRTISINERRVFVRLYLFGGKPVQHRMYCLGSNEGHRQQNGHYPFKTVPFLFDFRNWFAQLGKGE